MTIRSTFDLPLTRILIGLILGFPLTAIFGPLSLIGLASGLENIFLDYSRITSSLSIIILSLSGLLGLVGGWLRLVVSPEYIRSSTTTRHRILLFLFLGVISAVILCAELWYLSGLWSTAAWIYGIALIVGLLLIFLTIEWR